MSNKLPKEGTYYAILDCYGDLINKYVLKVSQYEICAINYKPNYVMEFKANEINSIQDLITLIYNKNKWIDDIKRNGQYSIPNSVDLHAGALYLEFQHRFEIAMDLYKKRSKNWKRNLDVIKKFCNK